MPPQRIAAINNIVGQRGLNAQYDTGFAVRPVGAAGATGAGLVVALATFEYAESPFAVLAARTRK